MWLSHPGSKAATKWIYGDDVNLSINPMFNESERRDMLEAAHGYVAKAVEHPDIYSDRLPRAERLVAALSS